MGSGVRLPPVELAPYRLENDAQLSEKQPAPWRMNRVRLRLTRERDAPGNLGPARGPSRAKFER
jgi:hypothetical protein